MLWYFPVPKDDMSWVDIPLLEFLGVGFNGLMFSNMITLGALPDWVAGLLRTIALAAALTLPRESQRSSSLTFAYFERLRDSPEWGHFAPLLFFQHLFGDSSPMADPISRAKWGEFRLW